MINHVLSWDALKGKTDTIIYQHNQNLSTIAKLKHQKVPDLHQRSVTCVCFTGDFYNQYCNKKPIKTEKSSLVDRDKLHDNNTNSYEVDILTTLEASDLLIANNELQSPLNEWERQVDFLT